MLEVINPSLLWFLIGILLFIIELILPGFILFFFGIGAWITALVCLTGWQVSFPLQIAIFLVTSLLSLFLLRKKMSVYFKGSVSEEKEYLQDIIGKKVRVVNKIIPGGIDGKVELNGTRWAAESDDEINKDELAEIISRKNLVLKVKKT
jgi:inner membrane protein